MLIQLILRWIPRSIVEAIPSWLTQMLIGHYPGFLAIYNDHDDGDESNDT
jgi:hypothetical protein